MTPHLFRLPLLAGAMLLSACSTLAPETCEQFEERRKTTNYATEYRLETTRLGKEFKPLRTNELAAVQDYRMNMGNDSVRPCSHVKIEKELTLLRRNIAGMVFEETREFFAENGTRIATKTETLSEQLVQSGRYSAQVPLPIPRNAPSGRYRLTSTLTVRMKGGKTTILARSNASFRVGAPEKPKGKF